MSKERPILFSGPMVRAILSGTKTQTRRVVNPQPDCNLVSTAHTASNRDPRAIAMKNGRYSIFCPYGATSDRLWVKETWRTGRSLDHVPPRALAEGAAIEYFADQWNEGHGLSDKGKGRPSIFMRRWMSRLVLEVQSIRVERLQDISEDDAWAEGITRIQDFGDNVNVASWSDGTVSLNFPSAREAYRSLWESINGPGSWDANPWVWVLTFKRL